MVWGGVVLRWRQDDASVASADALAGALLDCSSSPSPQGLFHPARRVRQVYWRLYNNTYIGAQDAMVACYPRMEDEGINLYRRHELDVFI